MKHGDHENGKQYVVCRAQAFMRLVWQGHAFVHSLRAGVSLLWTPALRSF